MGLQPKYGYLWLRPQQQLPPFGGLTSKEDVTSGYSWVTGSPQAKRGRGGGDKSINFKAQTLSFFQSQALLSFEVGESSREKQKSRPGGFPSEKTFPVYMKEEVALNLLPCPFLFVF